MKDDTLADDEARQATSREAVKSKVESRVNAEEAVALVLEANRAADARR